MPVKMFQRVFATQLRKNVLANAAGTLMSAAATLGIFPIVLRFLSYDEYGVWLSLGAITSLAQLAGTGIGSALTKYVAEAHGAEQASAVERVVTTALAMTVCLGAIVTVTTILLREQIFDALRFEGFARTQAEAIMPWVALLGGYLPLAQIPAATITGMGRADHGAIAGTLGRIATLAVSWVLFVLGFGLSAVVLGAASGSVVTHAYAERAISGEASYRWFRPGAASLAEARRIVGFSASVAGASVANGMIHPINKFLLTRAAGPASLPILEVAWSSGIQIRTLVASSLSVLLPDFSRAAAQGDPRRSQMLMRQSYRFLALGLPFGAAMYLLSSEILPLWLGSGYRPEQLAPFRMMLIAAVVATLGAPGYYFLLGINQAQRVLLTQVLKAVSHGIVTALLAASGALSPFNICLTFALISGATTWWFISRTARYLRDAIKKHPRDF